MTVRVLESDPDLARYVGNDRLAAARRELVAETALIKRGAADLAAMAPAGAAGVGLLILDGLVERDVLVADTISAELIGPGDLIRGVGEASATALIAPTVKWDVLADARVALLDARFARIALRYPEVHAALLDRMLERVYRLSTAQAISQLNGVDRRLLALFWHLGERWGRIGADGLLVPLDLPHRVLAQLVGARRPTVSTALGRLAERGELRHRDDGVWVVDRRSAEQWIPEQVRAVAPRRLRLVAPEPGFEHVVAVERSRSEPHPRIESLTASATDRTGA
jgi:CRP/FNR family cyclic AMP-dependent transcriptional regulator